ncbi:MAG: gamma-glutamyl-gamma-aminobutyrate hydrolase family protein [Bacteroidota bacterium]
MIYLGVSSCFLYPDPSRTVFGPKTLCYLEKDMARHLSRPGVMPILIPPELPRDERLQMLQEMDAFVFQGGSDIAPQSYGSQPIENGRWPGDPIRDEYELALMEYAISHGKPVYAICRGFQLMNVFFGGSLLQDIETQRPGSVRHRDAIQYDQLLHPVELTEGGLFADLYQDEPNRLVNSVHHQGIDEIGKDLIIEASCQEDGIIEAFSWRGAEPGRVVGVQWHPEFFWNASQPLMDCERLYSQILLWAGKPMA